MEEETNLENKGLELTFIQKSIFSEYIEEGETIIYIVSTHLWFLLGPFFKWSALFFPAIYVLIVFKDNPYVFLASLSVALISFTFFMFDWYNWYSDVFILTERNIIFIKWDSFIKLNSSRISYGEVESASIEMAGFMSTVFGFGTIKIDTANNALSHQIVGAGNVREAEQRILECKAIYGVNKKTGDGGDEAHIFKKALREILDEYLGDSKKQVNGEDGVNLRDYEIRGPRFHQTEELEQVINKSDLEDDRFEKYRLKNQEFTDLDFKNDQTIHQPDEREKIKQRFDKYRLKPEDLEI